jgi:hypothetical protein
VSEGLTAGERYDARGVTGERADLHLFAARALDLLVGLFRDGLGDRSLGAADLLACKVLDLGKRSGPPAGG